MDVAPDYGDFRDYGNSGDVLLDCFPPQAGFGAEDGAQGGDAKVVGGGPDPEGVLPLDVAASL